MDSFLGGDSDNGSVLVDSAQVSPMPPGGDLESILTSIMTREELDGLIADLSSSQSMNEESTMDTTFITSEMMQ